MKKLTFITLTLLLFAAQANAQMVMEWQSPEGVTPATLGLKLGDLFGKFRVDFNGDGFNDIPIFNKLGGQERFLKVISGADLNTTWQFPLTGVNFVPGQTKLIGFFDVDKGNGSEKEVVVANIWREEMTKFQAPAVINQSGLIMQFGDQYLLLGIADYDNDNDLEMLMGDSSVRVLELWGKGN